MAGGGEDAGVGAGVDPASVVAQGWMAGSEVVVPCYIWASDSPDQR